MAKDKPTAQLSVEIGGNQVSLIATERDFSSGARGFFMGDKLQDPNMGKRYQISCNIVEIGSKPAKK